MTLPPGFAFSQSSLQDETDCPRRFELRYVEGLRWPAAVAEPVAEHERRMAQGERLHRMVQGHHLGLPADLIAESLHDDPDLADWWAAYLASDYAFGGPLSGQRHVEMLLTTSIAGYRLAAKFDLLIFSHDGSVTIVDWKTSRPGTARHLRERWQSRVYRYVLVQAGRSLNGGRPIDPAQVRMVYWYATAPSQPVILPYDADSYAGDEHDLTAAITEIAGVVEQGGPFPLTTETRFCRFCVYRSLCDRGQQAGDLDEADADALDADDFVLDVDLDLDQIAEVVF